MINYLRAELTREIKLKNKAIKAESAAKLSKWTSIDVALKQNESEREDIAELLEFKAKYIKLLAAVKINDLKLPSDTLD